MPMNKRLAAFRNCVWETCSGLTQSIVSQFFVPILCPNMPIVTLSDALIQRLTTNDRRILRDRTLSGFCLRLNKRSKTFIVATTSNSLQVRVTIGRWPIYSTDEARSLAAQLLREFRNGDVPRKPTQHKLPTLREILPLYANAKGLKLSSLNRYESILRVHFDGWMDCSLRELASSAFDKHCHAFAQSRGAAIVEVGRGLIGAIFRYMNAVYGLNFESPFAQLAAAGLMPNRAEPRPRRLQESELPDWYEALQLMPEKQRDILLLLSMTGLRRNEGGMLRKNQVDFRKGLLHIPETKTGQPLVLPITPIMREILCRRAVGLTDEEMLFDGVALEHLADMAMRAGAPSFMLHDLRKMLATTGERLGLSDAVIRRILNHKAKRSDTLHRHYIQLSPQDINLQLESIQIQLLSLMKAKSSGNCY
jgi:integrase